MMAGPAKTGWRPFFAVYSTFLQRAFDQCFQEVSLQGLAVRLCLDRAGLVGGDGAVHHGFCDISLLACLPKACLLAAMDEPSLREALRFMAGYDAGLSAVRYPRDNVSSLFADQPCPPFVPGKARALCTHATPDVAVLGYGVMAIEAMKALEHLHTVAPDAPAGRDKGHGRGANGAASTHASSTLGEGRSEYKVSVYDARFAKPVDIDLLKDLLGRGIPVITVEDHSIRGGFGACVLEACNENQLDGRLVTRMGLPDSWIYQGERGEQMLEAGIDAASIARTIRTVLDRPHAGASKPAAKPMRGAAART
ncbi:MAG: transketolase C-terminal domain-containing protein [Phycisphaerales bacterium]